MSNLEEVYAMGEVIDQCKIEIRELKQENKELRGHLDDAIKVGLNPVISKESKVKQLEIIKEQALNK